jgi:hypothetical protein
MRSWFIPKMAAIGHQNRHKLELAAVLACRDCCAVLRLAAAADLSKTLCSYPRLLHSCQLHGFL